MSIAFQANLEMGTFRAAEADLMGLLREPIMAELTLRAVRITNAAKGFATGIGGGPHVRTGALRNSIWYWPMPDPISPRVDVGSPLLYSGYVEWGHRNKAHVYPIRGAGGSFQGFGFVSDRPTKAYHYLLPAIDAGRS